MGKRDSEHGPKLVKRPPRKIIRIDRGLVLFKPLLINDSPLRAKSDKVKLKEEMIKKLSSYNFNPQIIQFRFYLSDF